MGAKLTYLPRPIAEKDRVDGQVPRRARYGACAMQGWRRGMEDAHIAVPDLAGDGRCSLFGVFDGHGGCGVAKFAERHLPGLLLESDAFKRGDYSAALTDAFLAVDERLLTESGRAELRALDSPKGRVPITVTRRQFSSYAKGVGAQRAGRRLSDVDSPDEKSADEEVLIDPGAFKDVCPENQGATAVVALIVWDEQNDPSASRTRVIVANAGDSRCVLGSKGKDQSVEALAMSEDHKPELPSEAARIKAGGGQITWMPGGARVQGDLNLSRALGDFRHKQQQNVPPERQIVTASPEVRECTLGPEKQVLVLGCDGIWERNSNKKLMERLHSRLSAAHDGDRPSLSDLGAEVCDASMCPSMSTVEYPEFDGSGCDNMTILIVEFNESSEDAAAAEVQSKVTEAEPFPVSAIVAEVMEAVAQQDDTSEPILQADGEQIVSEDQTSSPKRSADNAAPPEVSLEKLVNKDPAAASPETATEHILREETSGAEVVANAVSLEAPEQVQPVASHNAITTVESEQAPAAMEGTAEANGEGVEDEPCGEPCRKMPRLES